MLKTSQQSTEVNQVIIDDEPWIVFIDESGDQGKPALKSLMDQEKMPGRIWDHVAGGSRFFTIGAVAVKASIVAEVERRLKHVEANPDLNERKWVSSSDSFKARFVATLTAVLVEFKDSVKVGGITLDKSFMTDQAIENRKVNVYNHMAKDLICRLTTTVKSNGKTKTTYVPQEIRIVCDARPVQASSFNDLARRVAENITEAANFSENVSCEPVNSKKYYMIQMADCISGLLRHNIERNKQQPGWKALSKLVDQKLVFQPALPIHQKYAEWTGPR